MKNYSIQRIGWISVLAIVLILPTILFIAKILFNLAPGDTFSLGQLLVEATLVPTVIIGFIIAITEFRLSQNTPKPRLYWEQSPGIITSEVNLKLPPGTGLIPTPRLVLKNEGKTVTAWYRVKFDIPETIYLDRPPSVERLIGDKIGLVTSDSHWHFERLSNITRWVFTSDGKYALYPNDLQPFCMLLFHISGDKQYPTECKIPFIIFTYILCVKISRANKKLPYNMSN